MVRIALLALAVVAAAAVANPFATAAPSAGPSVSVADARVREGDEGRRTARFVVRLSAKATRRVTVRFATRAGSARAESDFVARRGKVVFRPGQRRRVVRIGLVPDDTDEDVERFAVRLSRARTSTRSGRRRVRIADGRATAVVIDDTDEDVERFAVRLSRARTSTRSGRRVRIADGRATAVVIDDDPSPFTPENPTGRPPAGTPGQAGSPPSVPFIDRTRATIALDYTEMRIQQCLSTNDGRMGDPPPGIFAELETIYDGTVESDDPRLAGRIDAVGRGLARAEPDDGPFLPDTGQAGMVQGTFTITAKADGRRTSGTFFATAGRSATAGDPGVLQFEGLLQGLVDFLPDGRRDDRNDTDADGGQIIANFRGASSNWTADQVRLDVGGLPPADDPEQPAFVVGGDCGGPVQTRRRGDPPFAPMPMLPGR